MPKKLEGIVVSTKMIKAVVVKVERIFRHPLYKKIIKRHKKYKVRNEVLPLTVGDKVSIEETRPLSKQIHFKVTNKISP